MLLRRQKIEALKEKQEVADEHEQVYRNLVSQRYLCTYYKMRIDAAERRLASDNQKLKGLGGEISADRKDVVKESDSLNNAPSNGAFDFWNSNDAGTGDAEKMAVIGEFRQEWKQDKTDYEMWDFSKMGMEKNLAIYRQDLKNAQDKLKQLEAQWAQIQAQNKHDQKKLDTKIHTSIKQEVQDAMTQLEKLRDQRNRNLITAEEYARRKAEILKQF
jgi:DNA repair exonuclease SbcCD ATPase subunit